MGKKKTLGEIMVAGMKKLSFEQATRSMLATFCEYKTLVLEGNEGTPDPWISFHDLVALMWGYYGDLDLHIEQMEEKMVATIRGFQTREDLESFVQSVGDYKERYDEHVLDIRKHYNCINL